MEIKAVPTSVSGGLNKNVYSVYKFKTECKNWGKSSVHYFFPQFQTKNSREVTRKIYFYLKNMYIRFHFLKE